MKRTNSIKRALMGVLLLGAAAAALAQPGGGPGGQGGPGGRGGPGGPGGMGRGPQSVMMLIQMTSVQKELHLTADQIRQISEMRPPQGGPGGRGGQGGGPGGQGGPGGGPGGFGGPGGQGGPGGGFGGPGGQGGQGGGPGGGFGGPGGQGGRGGGPGEEGGPGGQGGRGGRGGRGGQGGQGGRGGQGGGPGGFGGPGGQGGGPGGFGGPGGGPGNMPNPLADILTPDQMKRLDQLGLQFDAPFSITSPKVADQLELTQEQHEQIGEIIAKSFPRPEGDRQGPGGGQGDRQGPPQGGQGERPPQMNWAEMQAKKTTATRAVLAILTAEQKKTWQKVTGNPFTAWEEPKRR